MRHLPLFMCTAFCGLYSSQTEAADKKNERPNILWLTFEDTSAYEFGCYGNGDVHTPNADSLAARGIQFMNAWSVAPQSSAARSSLITGCYSSTYGMDIHPVPYDTPADIFFPQRLREAGYYCTNNSKTHYNSTTDNKSCWDECNNKASYNSTKRGKDQPFFAVYNTVTSHMGRIRTFHTDGRRDYTQEGIFPQQLTLPSYVPDLPEVRSDYAGHLEAVQDVDTWLGIFLKDLETRGLEDNTIIFFFSDHGGCVARGKGYLYESGLKVPMIAYFPPKWRHLANGAKGKENGLVNFTDLGPTVLSLAGVKPPKNMQGKALYGKFASKEKREVQFALAANQLHHFMPVRAVTDGRFKYIRSYIPYRQFALRNYYQWGMPSNKAWDKLVLGGHNTNPDWKQTFEPHPAEMLFDLEKDPDELHDLSAIPEYAETLYKMRQALSDHIRTTHDLGFFLPNSRTGHILYEKVRKEKYPLDELYGLVEIAGTATVASLPMLEKAIASPLPEMRFWGVVGYANLARENQLDFKASGTAGKCIEGREFIIALPESFVEYKADDVVRLFTDSFHKRYGVECSAALHHNKRMTNYHIHLVFSERKMLEHPEVKIAIRNMFYDEQGKHRRTKKEILDEQGNLRVGCSIIPKGEVYESHIFTKKDEWFKNDAFTREVKEMFTEIINSHVKEESEKLSVFQQGGVYLATKKIGKNNPKEAEIRADNAARQEWNRTVDVALVEGVPEEDILTVKREKITDKTLQSIRTHGWLPDMFQQIIRGAKDFLQEMIFKFKLPPKPVPKIDLQEWNDMRKLMEKLQKQSQAMKSTQQELSLLKKQLSETTGFFKGKVRKSLEGKIEQA